MGRLTIAGLIAALTLVSFVVAASAQSTPPPPSQPRPDFWPPLDPSIKKPPVGEWYSDIPWHQKLGTFSGNEIDEALVLPYEALGADEKKFCTDNKLLPEDCMIETGVINILGIYRTDTPYLQTNSKITAATYCKTQSCIEVRLQASLFWTRSAGCKSTSTPPCVVQPRPFGFRPPKITNYGEYYNGVVLTEATSYAPQMPWYMSHYCDSKLSKDPKDPVCYADYFGAMNDGFNWLPGKNESDWPNSAPLSVFPFAPAPAPSNNCAPLYQNIVQTACQMALAGFDLSPVPQSLDDSTPSYKPYRPYNKFLLNWFNTALTQFPNNFTGADFYRHFPWSATTQVTWATDPNSPTDLYYQAVLNPFLGQFTSVNTQPAVVNTDKEVDLGCLGDGFTPLNPPDVFPIDCSNTGNMRAGHYLYPRACSLADLVGPHTNVDRLRACGLNYEFHPAGWLEEWPPYVCADTNQRSCGQGDYSWWQAIKAADMVANQYGRTSFLFAGVPGMQIPVSFGTIPGSVSGLSVYEQVHNASIFDVYLPIANEADTKNAYNGRNYGDPSDFYHTLLMTNHMESDPDEFAEGIRGKVLWHNEYRTRFMYKSGNPKFGARMFAAAFDSTKAPVPFHNNTCDGCHVRNGSGIPITPTSTDGTFYKLDASLQAPKGFMTTAGYNPYPTKDYTFTGQILPMKLVFFDLGRVTSSNDDSVYSKPLAFSAIRAPSAVKTGDLYYNNIIMQFYGDSFHVAKKDNPNFPIYNFSWSYVEIPPESPRLVVNTSRINSELAKTYQPMQVKLGAFQTDPGCKLAPKPPNTRKPWPTNCKQIDGSAIRVAIDGGSGFGGPSVGFMLLNGKRLGNLSAIEAIPNAAILGFHQSQIAAFGNNEKIAGEILWNAGSRDGVGGDVKKNCTDKSLNDCYIGRFGWLGDRVSLEDQVANAAFVEMNMTTSAGFNKLYPDGNVTFPIRYGFPNCGPADQKCRQSKANADLTERDVNRMAAYARWGGNPTRSEFMASLPDVIAGEAIFGQLNCNTCHVISKINITNPDDTMLSKFFRERLKTHLAQSASPFLSYLGTDLLMHDMGYLSQVSNISQSIRNPDDGTVLPNFKDSVQKIRTPALKGLRFNRFATDSQLNTNTPCSLGPTATCDPACDFLLHDGRACDAIEAAFLHDGPAVKQLDMINKLSALSATQVRQLRAFLYSL